MTVECAQCGRSFVAKRVNARFCSSSCRSRFHRNAKSSSQLREHVADKDDDLVKAVRRELEAAKALDTVAGQLALLLAAQVKHEPGARLPALVRELGRVIDEAKRAGPVIPDEVTRARRKRDEARRAAGIPPTRGPL